MRFRNKLALTAATLILTAGTSWAGVVFEVETTYHSGSPGVESAEMSVDKPNLKMEILPGRNGSSSAEKEEVIYKGAGDGKMVVINHEEQYYMEIDPKTVAEIGGQVAGQMDQAMKELNKHLEGLDPKQREMMEKMLKGKMGGASGMGGMGGMMPKPPKRAKSEFRKTSERATKKGYPCVKYEVTRGGEKIQELWVTDWNNVKGSGEVKATFKDMADFFEAMMKATEKMTGAKRGMFGGDHNMVETFAKLDGFPIVTRDFEDGDLESETVLESVTERDLDPDAFEPPAGYKLRTMGPG